MRTVSALLVLVALLISAPAIADTIQPDAMVIFENYPLFENYQLAPKDVTLSGSIGWSDTQGGLLSTAKFTITGTDTVYEPWYFSWVFVSEGLGSWVELIFRSPGSPYPFPELVFGPAQLGEACCSLGRGEYSTIPGTSKRVVDVPAPATLALLGSSLACLAGYAWLRRRRRQD
jgi:hypothetical protein